MSQLTQKEISWEFPPPAKVSSEQIGKEILEMYLSSLVQRKGTAKPVDIADGEVWQKVDGEGNLIGFYRWTTADGSADGVLILSGIATSEEASAGINNAKIMTPKNVKDNYLTLSGGTLSGNIYTPTIYSANGLRSLFDGVEFITTTSVSDGLFTFSSSAKQSDGSFFEVISVNESGIRGQNFNRTIPAPKPVDTAGSLGRFVSVYAGTSSNYTLPSGGTWIVFHLIITPTGAINVHLVDFRSGGTTLFKNSDETIRGFAWRIA